MALAYVPEMEWRAAYGPFESDRVCLGLYRLSGVEFPGPNLGEWKYRTRIPEQAFDRAADAGLGRDRCPDRLRRRLRARFHPQKSLRIHVPWCENDYQVDVATPAGRAEWKRILDQCAAVGIEHTLFTPANSLVAPLKDNADAWGWENCLWLGLGPENPQGRVEYRRGPDPAVDPGDARLCQSEECETRGLCLSDTGLEAGSRMDRWCGGKTGGYVGADTGVRSFQDWFVDQLVAFQKRTGISGYSFDHWWIAYEPNQEGFKPTSKYAQWYGCRRILEELRRRIPDVVIDGRQQYQWFGPWTWLGGSYPHPTTNDEQPGSFKNFPDLHFSRVSADRQRWAAWWYRMEQFTPLELVPGYMTHQTPRNDAQGQCVRDRDFQTRDWDYLGWRYSVLSSIGTAPFNNVVNLLPARDETEFKHFRPEDQRWLRQWIEWTDSNRATLRNLRPIIGPPRLRARGRDRGDRRRPRLCLPLQSELPRVDAEFALDASIGLSQGDQFLLRRSIPRRPMAGQAARGPWHLGDKVSLPIKGPEALVAGSGSGRRGPASRAARRPRHGRAAG